MPRDDGMTLIEVLVALVIISVGILAAVALQGSSLRATREAGLAAQLTNLAQGELEVQRQIVRDDTAAATPICTTPMPGSTYSCQITLLPCRASSSNVTCRTSSVTQAELAGHYAAVTVTGPGDESLTLNTLIRKHDD